MKNGKRIANILNVVLLACMAAIIVLFAVLPFIQIYITHYFIYLVPSLVFFYTAGVLAYWFLVGLRRLILSVRDGNPFTRRNVKILKHLSLSLFLLMLDFIFITCFVPSISKLLCIALLLLGVLCAQVLAHLIERAAEYREEIDLTV